MVNGVSGKTPLMVVATAAEIATVAGSSQRAAREPSAAGRRHTRDEPPRTAGRGRARELPPLRRAGKCRAASAVTDADGRARTVWTLGDLPGRQTLLATVERIDSALAVVAEADPVAANTRLPR